MRDGAARDPAAEPILRLGISSCLLGQEVRFNGGHKRDPFLVQTLGAYVEWLPLCPEVEIGLGVPRPSLRLAGDLGNPRLTSATGDDYTRQMQAWAERQVEEIASWNLHGFVLKRASPSCGLFRVKVYGKEGIPMPEGRGIFARVLAERFPLLPMEEEGRLHDPALRENFIERVYAYARWRKMLQGGQSPAALVAFHTAYKLTLLAHSPEHYRRLGRLVARAGELSWERLVDSYGEEWMDALKIVATRGRHANALQHVQGFLKQALDSLDRQELASSIEDYRRGLVPLIVPITLLKHHLGRHPTDPWLDQQVYLNPYPRELMLRNHV